MSGRIGRASTLVALLAATLMAPAPATASAQRYDGIVTIKEKIPTRLGEKLYADISFPATDGNAATGRLPVILYYAPYCPGVSQQSWWVAQGPPPSFWTRHGYIHANVQWPGSCGSEGREGFISPELGQAGSEAVEWLARHTWAGKIGMAGVSSPAIAQLHVAARRPPHLTTITPATPTADPYSDIVYPGGILSLEAAAAILGSAVPTWYATGVAARLGDADAARQMLASFGFLPGPAYAEVLSHPLKDRFWTDRTVDMSNVDIPMFLLNSLDDFYTRSTRIFHDTRGRENRLVLGPGGHANPTTQHGLNTELLAWMDAG